MTTPDPKVGKCMIGVGCIMEHIPSGKILCLLRDRASFNKQKWELMYGRIDQHEELFEAVQREVKEEIGLEVFTIERLLRVWHFYRGEKQAETEIHGFTFHCTTTTQEITLSDEHSEYRWADPSEALELITVEGVREDIRFFMENRNNRQVAFSGVNNKIERVL
jgi:8-oxo-dGTP diphosphatase